MIDGYKRIGLGQLDVAAAVVPQQPFDSLAAREAAIEERERHLEEAIAEIAAFDAYQDLQRQAEVVQPPPPPAVHPAAAPAPAPAPVQQPAPPPAAQAAPANANANAPPDPNANANPNANPNANANHDPNHAAAVAVEAEAEDEPPLAECPKCSFPLSAVPAADAESHLRACLDSEGASLAECPVCEASLSGMESAAERERHVDACCRGLGGTSTADGGGAAAAGADESSGPGARAALAAGRGNGEAKRQKREHVGESFFSGISCRFFVSLPYGPVPFADERRSSILPAGTVFVSDEKTIPKDEKTGQPLEVRVQLSLSHSLAGGFACLPLLGLTGPSPCACRTPSRHANSASCALTSLKPSSDSRGCRATACTTKSASSRTGRTRAVRPRPFSLPHVGSSSWKDADSLFGINTEFCPTHRELDTTPEVQMRAI